MVKKENKKDIKVVNIVVSTSLEHDIPLEKMAATLSNTEYNPEQFPGLVIRIKEPKTSALIFSSGKIVCTGARSMEKVHESIKKIIKSLEKINVKITIKPQINIQNIVASGSIGMDLNLNTLAMKLENTEYEPEQFPGLVYKLGGTSGFAKATFLLFSNGKIVCTGARTIDKVQESIKKIIKSLEKIKIKITIKPEIKIQNIVASGAVGMDLNLNELATKLQNVEYEPEQFPGLVYKLPPTKSSPQATFLLFSNGKIVCTGTKSEKEVHLALDKLIENLKKAKA